MKKIFFLFCLLGLIAFSPLTAGIEEAGFSPEQVDSPPPVTAPKNPAASVQPASQPESAVQSPEEKAAEPSVSDEKPQVQAAQPEVTGSQYVRLEGKVVPGSGHRVNYPVASRGFETYQHQNFVYIFKIRGQGRETTVVFDRELDANDGKVVEVYGYFFPESNTPGLKLSNFVKAYTVVNF